MNNPMQNKLPMHQSPRCEAKTRKGIPCQSPAMPNGRCRMHGGKSPGAPKGNRNAWKHGRYSAETLQARRMLNAFVRVAKRRIEDI
jgi:glucans biosynthesis protein